MSEARRVPTTLEGSSEVGIHVVGLRKAYKIYEQRFDFLKEAITGRPYHREKEVLRGIDLTVRRGEVVGVIGRNGAGKSTLLKVLAGTLAATAGTVQVSGRVSAILELGTGFNPAYSGRDNVIMSAMMRGLSEPEILEKLDSVVAFAGLEDVINEPFHTYSSGMQARLAFAASIAVDADVLIVDEALAAGDIRFAARSISRIHEICEGGVTALFVSHVSYHIMQLCTRAIWIEDGRIKMDGQPVDVVRAYEYEMHKAVARDQGRMSRTTEARPAPRNSGAVTSPTIAITAEATRSTAGSDAARTDDQQRVVETNPPQGVSVAHDERASRHFSSGQYRITGLEFLDGSGRPTKSVRQNTPFTIRVSYECLMRELPEQSCGLAVAFNRLADFEAVMYLNTNYPHSDEEIVDYDAAPFRRYVGRQGVIEARLKPMQLRAGQYYVSLGILPNRPGPHEFYEYRHCEHVVTVLANGFDEPAVFYPSVSWSNGPTSDVC